MSAVRFPPGFRMERLAKSHPRRAFASGQVEVDDWLKTKALQNQDKRLSVTTVLLDEAGAIAGYFTLATGQIDVNDLPPEVAKGLPKRAVPAAVLAWLGVATERQGQGLGKALLAQAMTDCHSAGQTFAFVAVLLDCVNDDAKAFYQRFGFTELPNRPLKLHLPADALAALVAGQ